MHITMYPLQGEEGNDIANANDRIPNGTLRHIASFLAPEASDPSITDAAKLFHLLRTSNDMIRRRRSERQPESSSIPIPFSTPFHANGSSIEDVDDTKNKKNNLTSLPLELLTLLRAYLDPSDLICLSLTCRNLEHALDYHLSDLGAIAAAWEPSALAHDRGVRAALARQRYDATARLDRDRIEVLLAGSRRDGDGDSRVCGVCVRRHPRDWFGNGETGDGVGTCRAAEAKIRLCEHWCEDLVSLRARRRRVRCGGRTRAWWEECEHPSHHHHRGKNSRLDDYSDGGDDRFGPPCMLEFGGVFVVERTMVLMRTKRPRRSIGCETVRDALSRRARVWICPHVALGDEVIAKTFGRRSGASREDFAEKDRERVLELPEYEIMSCKGCGCHWSFEVKSFEGKTTVRLNADLQLPVLKDPWDEDYLRNLEDGAGLLDSINYGKRLDIRASEMWHHTNSDHSWPL